MKLPDITTKQQDILEHLYTYRYLDRIQIQTLMNHKDKRRVIAWLKDLKNKHYVEWIYSTDFALKTKPAIYYLGINGVRYLKTVLGDDDSSFYPIEELRKRYNDSKRSRTFVERCLVIANCCLTLRPTNDKVSYDSFTESDYIDPDHDYHFLAKHEVLRPSLCIIKQEEKREEVLTTNYLLEVFDASLPRYRLRYRLKNYVAYLDDGEWEGDEPEPIVLLVCSSLTDLIYAKRATKKLIEDTYNEEVHIRFTTTEQLKIHGARSSIWEEGRKLSSL